MGIFYREESTYITIQYRMIVKGEKSANSSTNGFFGIHQCTRMNKCPANKYGTLFTNCTYEFFSNMLLITGGIASCSRALFMAP